VWSRRGEEVVGAGASVRRSEHELEVTLEGTDSLWTAEWVPGDGSVEQWHTLRIIDRDQTGRERALV
jgi:hypothetical protein